MDRSPSVNDNGPIDMLIQSRPEPLYSRYDLVTGQTTYILIDMCKDLGEFLAGLAHRLGQFPSSVFAPVGHSHGHNFLRVIHSIAEDRAPRRIAALD